MKLNRNELKYFTARVAELMQSSQLERLNQFCQHGDTSCLLHSLAVAYYSFAFVKRFHIACDEKSLITGALLHDYFLYDWHVPDKSHRLHGFRHPGVALRNARKIRRLNKIEENIIARHMFPLTPMPPAYRESYIICCVDKFCSLKEIIQKTPYEVIQKLKLC